MSVMRTKTVEQSIHEGDEPDYHLKRRLSALDLTVFGIGVIIGAGIFTLTGRAAKEVAGPSIVLSFVLAAVCCGLAALCYAEFASTVPVSGSAYTFSYASLGEIVAWIIGWDLLLEMLLGSAVVAQGWSSYLGVFLGHLGIDIPESVGYGSRFDLMAFLLVGGAHRAGQHRHQGVDAGQHRPGRAEAVHRAVRHRGRHRVHQPGQLLAVHPTVAAGAHQECAGVAAHPDRARVHPDHVRPARHRVRCLARLLRLHRLRRGRDDGRGGEEPAAGPADRHHRLARHLHGALLRGRARHHGDDPVRPDLAARRRWRPRSRPWANRRTRPGSPPELWQG